MMLKVFLLAPYVALACSFLLATVVSMICISHSDGPAEARGFALRAKTAPAKSRRRPSSPPHAGKRAFRDAAA